ncbi:alkane 1-monooxygenase [Oceaniglobus roseus]|uniref:alkane 1-monooxygenase n=1 Tax=Oceaniglobus roseus TaxID=1737570 RepID=UPI000C7ECDF8|nr:alkane 1-monooxygenase [Kandeliimicrobium roseum]
MDRASLFDSHPVFVAATLGPVPLLLAAAWLGGPLVWLALAAMTLFVPLMDVLVRRLPPPLEGAEFPAGTALSVAIGAAQVLLLLSAVATLAGAGLGLDGPQAVAMFFAVGLWLGQVGNSNAHELIHRSDRRLFTLGKWLFISLLFGHHTSAHRKIHHSYVASDDDPNSARLGESFPAFALRAWQGSFLAGWEIERSLQRRAGRVSTLRHPYAEYVGGALLCLGLAWLIGGLAGLLWYVALAVYAQMQLLLSDYVQHYGLERREVAPGRLEPVGPAHSWNAPHVWSGAMMLNAPRHSDHHANPARPWPELRIGGPEEVPTLPRSLPVMAIIAFWPPAWFRLMDRRAKAWNARTRERAAA